MISIAHRGASGHAPENTIASVKKALELGASFIEVDVYRAGGRLMVFHDDRLERATNGTGLLVDKSFEQLRELDAGDGQKIPTLEEVFDAVDRRAGVNIELKGEGTAGPVAAFVAERRNKGWKDELILVSSFNHKELEALRASDGRVRIGLLFDGPPDLRPDLVGKTNTYSINIAKEYADKDTVDSAHSLNLRVFVFTVNDPGDISRMRDIRADGVFTDFPERVTAHGP